MLSKLSQTNALLRTAVLANAKYTSQMCGYTTVSSTKKGQTISLSNLNEMNEQLQPPNKPKLDLSFEDCQTAFKAKSNFELLRGYLVFQLCSMNFLVENQKKVRTQYP